MIHARAIDSSPTLSCVVQLSKTAKAKAPSVIQPRFIVRPALEDARPLFATTHSPWSAARCRAPTVLAARRLPHAGRASRRYDRKDSWLDRSEVVRTQSDPPAEP